MLWRFARPLSLAPERYVDARELAAVMGVSLSTIRRMVRAGMPSETWGMTRTRRFLPSACIEWARGRADRVGDVNSARRAVQRPPSAIEGDSFDG